jgi:hypothetical protein
LYNRGTARRPSPCILPLASDFEKEFVGYT